MFSMVHIKLEEIKKSLYSSWLNVKQWQKWWWPDWFVCCRSNPGNNPAGPSWPGRHNISFHRGLLHMDREILEASLFFCFFIIILNSFFTTFLDLNLDFMKNKCTFSSNVCSLLILSMSWRSQTINQLFTSLTNGYLIGDINNFLPRTISKKD